MIRATVFTLDRETMTEEVLDWVEQPNIQMAAHYVVPLIIHHKSGKKEVFVKFEDVE